MEGSEGFKYAIGWNPPCLKTVGVWPEPDDGWITRCRAWFCVFFIFLIIYLPQSASIFIFWGDMDSVVECLSVNGPLFLAMLKIFVFRYYRKVLEEFIKTMAEDWATPKSLEAREVMMKTAKISHVISIVSASLTNTLFVAYIIFRIWLGIEMKKQADLDPKLSIGLPHPAYFPYDTTKFEFFLPTWIAQCIATFFCMTSYAAFDSFMSTMLLHLCGQLELIGLSFKELVNGASYSDSLELQKNFGYIVQNHGKLNRLGKQIEDSFCFVLLFQMLICTLTFCFQGFGMISNLMGNSKGNVSILEILFSIVYVFYTVLHLFVYCYVGDYLRVKSTSISDIFYESSWYKLPRHQMKWFLFIEYRCQKPLTISAGKFCKFSRHLFLVILKTSVGYLSMLLAVRRDKIS